MKRTSFRHLLTAALLTGIAVAPIVSYAQPTTATDAKKTTAAKAPKPKSRTERASIAALTANSIQVTTKDGPIDVALTGTTEFWRQDDNLKVAELKVGDMLAFTLRGTDGHPTVTSLLPFTLKFGEEATLVLNKTEKTTFDKLTLIKSSDMAVGNNVSLAMNVLADGKMEARRVTMLVAKPKAAAKPKTAANP